MTTSAKQGCDERDLASRLISSEADAQSSRTGITMTSRKGGFCVTVSLPSERRGLQSRKVGPHPLETRAKPAFSLLKINSLWTANRKRSALLPEVFPFKNSSALGSENYTILPPIQLMRDLAQDALPEPAGAAPLSPPVEPDTDQGASRSSLSRQMTRKAKLFWLIAILAQFALFLWIARVRFVDTDEGYYLLAAKLVLMHKRPYLDFFFQQAPLLPYVYALWLKCFHVTWDWARTLPVLLTAVLGLLLYKHIWDETRSWLAGVSAVLLFAASTLVFAWMPIAKPYSLAGLLLFCAYLATGRCSREASGWPAVIGGISLGLAVDTRSYLLLTAPLFLWWIFKHSPARWSAALRFLAGFAIGLLPSLYFFLSSPSAFLFDNLGYHAIRTNQGLVGMWGEKFVVLLMLLLGGPEGNGIQNSLLLIASLIFISSTIKSSSLPRFAFQLAILLAVISLLPTPVLPQYFSFCIPFLIVSAVCGTTRAIESLNPGSYRLLGASACILAMVLYIAASVPDFRKYLVTGDGIPTVRTVRDPSDWRLGAVRAVSNSIDQLAFPGQAVASFWPGYLFESHAVPVSGLETDCGIPIADKLTEAQRGKYHIISWPELSANFERQWPRIVVLQDHYGRQNMLAPEVLDAVIPNTLRSHGYSVTRSFGDTFIFVCCSTEVGSGGGRATNVYRDVSNTTRHSIALGLK